MIPRVTVLMTVYNGMPYLPQAIESVLRQTFADFELLIIDDASTDGSIFCIGSYGDPRIRLVRNDQNMGQAASLNKGLSLVASDFIARLDQDDVCVPSRLEKQLAYLENHPEAAAVGSSVAWINSKGRTLGVTGFRIDDFGSFVGVLLGQATPVAHPTAVFRREILKKLGGYDPSYAPCEDYELWCRVALCRCSVGLIREPLLLLRLHEGQQSHARITLQQEHARRSHEKFLAAFSPPAQVTQIGQLLRMEMAFWERAVSLREVRSVCQALQETFRTLSHSLQLHAAERGHLEDQISKWLARASFLAILNRKRQSRSVHGTAWRMKRRPWISPVLLAYPVLFLVSPILIFPIRALVGRCAWWINRQRYTARLILHTLKTQ